VIGFRTIGIAKLLILFFRLEAASAPLAYSGLIFPGIGAAGFVANNIVDNGHVTRITFHEYVFRH
jgi:hypothetical protein